MTHAVRAHLLLSAACLGLLSACASNPEGDRAEPAPTLPAKFAPHSLSPLIAKQLPASASAAPGGGFGKLVITTRSNSEQAGGRKEAWQSVMTLVDGGNGLVQTTTELSANDVAYGRIHSLSYRGLIDLRWQNVQLANSNPSPIYEVKNARRIDALPTGADQEFVAEFESGAEAQSANFQTSQRRCKSLRVLPARELHAKLPGQATELECTQKNNTGAPQHSRWMLLQDWGVAILVESRSGSRKIDVRLLDVNS